LLRRAIATASVVRSWRHPGRPPPASPPRYTTAAAVVNPNRTSPWRGSTGGHVRYGPATTADLADSPPSATHVERDGRHRISGGDRYRLQPHLFGYSPEPSRERPRRALVLPTRTCRSPARPCPGRVHTPSLREGVPSPPPPLYFTLCCSLLPVLWQTHMCVSDAPRNGRGRLGNRSSIRLAAPADRPAPGTVVWTTRLLACARHTPFKLAGGLPSFGYQRRFSSTDAWWAHLLDPRPSRRCQLGAIGIFSCDA